MKRRTTLFWSRCVVMALCLSLSGGAAAEPVVKARGGRAAATKDAGAKQGWVRIYTNGAAQVTVDGKPYPRRSENGLMVSAGEPHEVRVKLNEKEKVYKVVVRPRELRTLLVDLTGYQAPPPPASPTVGKPAAFEPPPGDDEPKEPEGEEGEAGKLTVYSKPKGEVYVDGSAVGATTPMINRELELGRHEVQVKWENGTMSEVKTIRIRNGSKLKLFFRDRSEDN